jgi:hypothetical protein
VFRAAAPHLRPQRQRPAVVGPEAGDGAVGSLAEVCRVDDQALAAALHGEDEPADRGVGGVFEDVAYAAVDRVYAAVEVKLDRQGGGTVQHRHQVGQVVGGGAQVDRAFQGLVEQRREGAGVAVDRSLRAGGGGELDAGADLLLIALIPNQTDLFP